LVFPSNALVAAEFDALKLLLHVPHKVRVLHVAVASLRQVVPQVIEFARQSCGSYQRSALNQSGSALSSPLGASMNTKSPRRRANFPFML